MPIISNLANTSKLLPHGFCIKWTPALLWMYVISDVLIVFAYYLIPITIIYFVRNRKDLVFSKIFIMFCAFIFACGTTHLLSIITLWHPIYWIDAGMKALTALISVATAFSLIKLVPKALQLPTSNQLNYEVLQRLHADDSLKASKISQQESEERMSLAIRAAGIGIWDLNLQTMQLLWDNTMFELFDLKREEFNNTIGASRRLLHPDDRMRAANVLDAVIENGNDLDIEFRIVCKNNSIRYIKAIGKAFFDDAGLPIRILGANMDITERAVIDKMKSELIATAAHELRSPLTLIYGNAELLNTDKGTKYEQEKMLATIYTQSQVMINLLNDMLDLARIEAQAVGLYQMKLQQIGPRLKVLAETFITPGNQNMVNVVLSPNLPEVKVDIAKLEQAIRNCLSNAYKYSPKGSGVNMRVTEVMHDQQRQLLITIEDQGIGMTPEELEHVFEKFYRADPSGVIPGTGLGMAIIKSIIEAHDGTIEIQSKYGIGTKVILFLPVA